MKKVLSLILATALTAGMLASCSSGSGNTSTSSTANSTPSSAAGSSAAGSDTAATNMSDVTLVFASDAVGSGSYNIIVEMSKVLENDGGFGLIDVQPVSPGGMGAPYLFAANDVDLCFVNGAPAKWASETGTLGKDPTSGYSAILGGLSAVCYINCISNDFLTKHGVSSIEEVFEQKLPIRIGCSTMGSMDAEGVHLLMAYYGVTAEDIQSWGGSITYQSGSENQAALQDGKIDFYVDHTSSSSSTMAEIATTCDVTFLQWGDTLIDWFVTEKGFARVTVPVSSFRGQDTELVLPGSPDAIFVADDLDEEIVYQLTKTLSENRDALVATVSSLSPWDPATAWEAELRGGVDLHPGAERYYREAGYMS